MSSDPGRVRKLLVDRGFEMMVTTPEEAQPQ